MHHLFAWDWCFPAILLNTSLTLFRNFQPLTSRTDTTEMETCSSVTDTTILNSRSPADSILCIQYIALHHTYPTSYTLHTTWFTHNHWPVSYTGQCTQHTASNCFPSIKQGISEYSWRRLRNTWVELLNSSRELPNWTGRFFRGKWIRGVKWMSGVTQSRLRWVFEWLGYVVRVYGQFIKNVQS